MGSEPSWGRERHLREGRIWLLPPLTRLEPLGVVGLGSMAPSRRRPGAGGPDKEESRARRKSAIHLTAPGRRGSLRPGPAGASRGQETAARPGRGTGGIATETVAAVQMQLCSLRR